MSANPVLDKVRAALAKADPGRESDGRMWERPAILPARMPGSQDEEIEQLMQEVRALHGSARRVAKDMLRQAFSELVHEQGVKKAALWPHTLLGSLGVEVALRELGVQVAPAGAGKETLAQCDLGVTGVDFALPETGSIGLLSSQERPRAVSLLPRIHLALMEPSALRADLHQVFAEAKKHHYLILIGGPSRTSDIELTMALGVHGPQAFHLWVLD